ncbi:MAG TPA: hypothetical protein VF331_10745 [Polyangiales bacterium]
MMPRARPETAAMGIASCAFGLIVLAAGCLGSSSTGGGRSDGTLVVDWTINGTTDPSRCTQSAATTLDVIINTASGNFVGEFQADCAAFATSIDLPAGRYTANAVLLDARGTERTTQLDIGAFRILGGDSLDVPIDFPARSFL